MGSGRGSYRKSDGAGREGRRKMELVVANVKVTKHEIQSPYNKTSDILVPMSNAVKIPMSL